MALRRRALAGLLLALAVTSGHARHRASRAADDARAGQFDYYVLSLSWAPTYCLIHPGDGAECAGKGYGFVVHGLWPQYDAGGYPENCATGYDLTAAAATKGRSVYPSPHLMQHEWQAHGTCSGLEASSYFDAVDRASAAVNIPATLDAPRNDMALTVAQIAALFQRANVGLPDNALTLACSRRNLSEVRVCLTKELTVRSCGRGVRSSCPPTAIGVPASR